MEDINAIEYTPCGCYYSREMPRISATYDVKSGKVWFLFCAWCGSVLYQAEEAHEFGIG